VNDKSNLTAGAWPLASMVSAPRGEAFGATLSAAASALGATVVQLRPPKPQYHPPNLAMIPDALKAERNWVVWRAEQPKPGKPKWRKVPYTPLEFVPSKNDPKKNSAAPADTAVPSTWRSYVQAVQAYRASH